MSDATLTLTFTIAFAHIYFAKINWTNSNCYSYSRVHIAMPAVVYAEEAFV